MKSSKRGPFRLSDASDEELMVDIQLQRRGAMGRLYNRYAGLLRAFICRIIHDESEAEDVLQDVFMEIWRNAKNYSSSKGKPLGWMVTMARRRAIDRIRRRECYERVEERFQRSLKMGLQGPQERSGLEEVELRDLHEILSGAMDRLPPTQKEAVELAYFMGLSQREIAIRNGLPLGTVKTRLELGMRKVANRLRGFAHEL